MEWTAGAPRSQALGSHFRQFRGAARGQQQARALGGEGNCGGAANSGAGAGDKDDSAFQIHATILTNAVESGR